MKDAVNHVGDRLGLPGGWLNMDFKNTSSYTTKLLEVSVYYKTFSNVITVRMVAAEYLIAMKLISGRQYKNDLSDIVGILWEHQKNGNPISREAIDKAVTVLYGENAEIPAAARKTLDDTFAKGDFEQYISRFMQAMDDDFNTADAISIIFELVRFVNTTISEKPGTEFLLEAQATLEKLMGILGFDLAEQPQETPDENIEALINARQEARHNKNFAEADRIRDELTNLGIILEDTREGIRWHRA